MKNELKAPATVAEEKNTAIREPISDRLYQLCTPILKVPEAAIRTND